MKKNFFILVAIILAFVSLNANAQLVYQPFIPNQSSPSYNGGLNCGTGSSYSGYSPLSCRTQTIRTTAYFVDFYGDYYKVPIRVEYKVYSNGAESLKVAEQYESNGFGGQWKRLSTPPNVMNCQSIMATGVTAELERTFMYKAMVGTTWYYFDL